LESARHGQETGMITVMADVSLDTSTHVHWDLGIRLLLVNLLDYLVVINWARILQATLICTVLL
jgi:hypothetical protein